MQSRPLLIGALLALTASLLAAPTASAIVGGTESTQPYSFMVSFQLPDPTGVERRPDPHKCGGALLAAQWVLTAYHCVANGAATDPTVGVPKNWKARVGSLDTTTGGELVDVDKFYRMEYDGKFWGKDIALLHLKTPVRAEPVRLAAASPAVGTPARIPGWGSTQINCRKAECYPQKLREADAVVLPLADCGAGDNELCIGGAADGPVKKAEDMDSGSPALVREGDHWAVAGVTSSGDADRSVAYTDATKHVDWINGIITGTDVPPDVPIPDVAGRVRMVGCGASVVRAPDARPEDPALLLTAGHCVRPQRPAPGQALIDQPSDIDHVMYISDAQGYPQATIRPTRLVYATMTGTDIALYRLDKTYGQLAAEGAKVFRLTTTPMRAGDQLPMALNAQSMSCTAEAVVSHLREGGYQEDNSVRYVTTSECDPGHGASGAALLSPDGNTVVGVHNTHSDDGAMCTDNNPCEVDSNGTVTATKGRAYGQQVDMIAGCLTAGSTLDLTKPDCTLTGAAR